MYNRTLCDDDGPEDDLGDDDEEEVQDEVCKHTGGLLSEQKLSCIERDECQSSRISMCNEDSELAEARNRNSSNEEWGQAKLEVWWHEESGEAKLGAESLDWNLDTCGSNNPAGNRLTPGQHNPDKRGRLTPIQTVNPALLPFLRRTVEKSQTSATSVILQAI